jgi:hypothetical protein
VRRHGFVSVVHETKAIHYGRRLSLHALPSRIERLPLDIKPYHPPLGANLAKQKQGIMPVSQGRVDDEVVRSNRVSSN